MSRSQSKQISSDELRQLINEAYNHDEEERIEKLREYGILDEELDYVGKLVVEVHLGVGAPSIEEVSEALTKHVLTFDLAGVRIDSVSEDSYEGWELT